MLIILISVIIILIINLYFPLRELVVDRKIFLLNFLSPGIGLLTKIVLSNLTKLNLNAIRKTFLRNY